MDIQDHGTGTYKEINIKVVISGKFKNLNKITKI